MEQLKEQVLQLAVQGKLTETWRQAHSGDEPASEGLKRIQAERAQFIKAKKIKKQKPLPPNNVKGAQKSMPKINQGTVINAKIALPPLAEQSAIIKK